MINLKHSYLSVKFTLCVLILFLGISRDQVARELRMMIIMLLLFLFFFLLASRYKAFVTHGDGGGSGASALRDLCQFGKKLSLLLFFFHWFL